jgi:DNA-binding transcriptional ArsR family regulator
LATALAIWFLSGLRHGGTDGLRLTAATLKPFQVDRSAKSRALKALEGAGLIRVQRRDRKNPVVTILDVGPDGDVAAVACKKTGGVRPEPK